MVVSGRLTLLMVVLGAGFLSFSITSAARQMSSMSVPPSQTAADQLRSPSVLTLSGIGDQAEAALRSAPAALPFPPLLPAYVPDGYVLARSETKVTNASAALDVAWTASGGRQLHLFEVNAPITKPKATVGLNREILRVGPRAWNYELLEFPQPNGPSLFVHLLEAQVDDLVVSIDLRSSGNLALEKELLARVAASLR